MTFQREPAPIRITDAVEVPEVPELHDDGKNLSDVAKDIARVAHLAHFSVPPNGIPGGLSAEQSAFLRNVEKSAQAIDPQVHVDTSE